MSLFPAYSKNDELSKDAAPAVNTSEWLENNSYPVHTEHIINIQDESTEENDFPKEKKKHKHKKKSKKHRRTEKEIVPEKPLEFDGNEDYYVDKIPALQYKSIKTLKKPAIPRYRLHYKRKLGLSNWSLHNTNYNSKEVKRYYQLKRENNSSGPLKIALDENEYTLRLGQLNRKVMEEPGQLQNWLDLVSLQEINPYKWSRLLLGEKKIDLVQRALVYHPRNEALYRLYIDTVNATYPSFEVSRLLDRLLLKDPHNYTIWTALIMTTQGSMARCIVPDVLRIYERCMQKMHHAQKQIVGGTDVSDEIMMQLFNNCALFLRQAGLNEQFFALVKLALELNVSTNNFENFVPLDSDQQTLIDYEELILQSGLPMNEIWLRIEKLRQGFNFLPCPVNTKCSDPQRIVFNEDVCHYIYPLHSNDNTFYLKLLILRLMKVPFVQCDALAEKFCKRIEHMGESDAIEDLLAVCVRRNFTLPEREHDEFIGGIYELVKEMAVGPTFISTCIGHELYERCITQLLMNFAAVYQGVDERKRILFVMIWCRFERLLLLLQKSSKKLNITYLKAGRSRFKALLKEKPNRDVLNLYTEFAIYEYAALSQSDSLEPVQNIFENIIVANSSEETLSSDFCHTFVTYAEILIGRHSYEEALQVLASYALSVDIKSKATISVAKKLAALNIIKEKLEKTMAIESNVEIMLLEQYLLPDYTISLLKVRILIQYLIGQKLDALSFLDTLLKTFLRGSDRHSFLRESIQELYITILQLPNIDGNCIVPNGVVTKKTFAALKEFPRNLFIMQRCSMLDSVAWFKIRPAMLHDNPNILAISFLIIMARCRFIQARHTQFQLLAVESVAECDQKHNEMIVRNRILNMFKSLIPNSDGGSQAYSSLQRNALFWRFYLRCLSDQSTAFETSKKCLLTALDECPWSKALYLDGATYVPQELSHLQDLIIEKHLRIYALPEELEILRAQ